MSDAKPPLRSERNNPSRIGGKQNQNNNWQADQEVINRCPVAIVGLGAAGSQLAEELAKLGVAQFALIDPGVVRKAELSTQGFHEDEMGVAKVYAVADRLQRIRGSIGALTHVADWHPNESTIPERAAIFLADCAIGVRRQLFDQWLLRGKTPCLLDVRASAEAFQRFCVPRDAPQIIHAYSQSLQPQHESFPQRRPACAATYCAAMAAGALCAMYRQWALREPRGLWRSRLDFSARTLSVLHCEIQPPA